MSSGLVATATIPASAAATGTVTGKVVYPPGINADLCHTDVGVYAADDASAPEVGSGDTADDGTYTVQGLDAGRYKIYFYSTGCNVVNEWWGQTQDHADAQILQLAAEQTSTVNVILTKGATITGTVTYPRGVDPTTGVVGVNAYKVGNPDMYVRDAWLAGQSPTHYRVEGLAPGRYKVQFTPIDPNETGGGKPLAVATEWWNDRASFADADVITVSTGQTRPGVNATLSTLPPVLRSQTPKIVGTPSVGATLAVDRGTWQVGSTFSYRWRANGSLVSGGTKATLKVGSELVGKRLSVTVTGSRKGYTPASRQSVPTLKVAKTSVPAIKGKARVGTKLTAKHGSWTTGTSFTYRWYANGHKITGATKATFVLTRKQRDTKITVKVTGKKSGYPTITRVSKKSGKVK